MPIYPVSTLNNFHALCMSGILCIEYYLLEIVFSATVEIKTRRLSSKMQLWGCHNQFEKIFVLIFLIQKACFWYKYISEFLLFDYIYTVV